MDDEDKQVNSLIGPVHFILIIKPHVAVPHICCQASSKPRHLGYNYRLGSEPVKFPCSKKKQLTYSYPWVLKSLLECVQSRLLI